MVAGGGGGGSRAFVSRQYIFAKKKKLLPNIKIKHRDRHPQLKSAIRKNIM
jgi:hypothetical protein